MLTLEIMETSRKLNILMCCYLPLNPSLGGAKGYIEVAQNYRSLGHSVNLVGIDEIVGSDQPYMDEQWRIDNYPAKLKAFLIKNANNYDIIEYESLYLPFSMKDHIKCILAIRCSLLDIYFREIRIPRFRGPRPFFGSILKFWFRKNRLNKKIQQSLISMQHADYINVQNPADQLILVKNGVDPSKIILQPLGLFQDRYNELKQSKTHTINPGSKIIIAFVGTFDARKGAVEFPQIIKTLLELHPEVEFKLLGVLGMFSTIESIYQYIGHQFRSRVHIHGKFSPKDLPILLSDCSYGIFPSYVESFGYGVLEMMAAGLPVVGYNSPGINALLLKELTVEPGNIYDLVKTFNKLINDRNFTESCKIKCDETVLRFIYEKQENIAIKTYQKRLLEILK